MDWNKEYLSWPNSQESKFVSAEPHYWHIQDSKADNKDMPIMVLLHGAGASTHSWDGLYNELKHFFRVIAVDLPGHGFTKLGPRNRSSLEKITEDLQILLELLQITPDLMVGHSAGAAVALRFALNKRLEPKGIVSINGALDNFPGLAGILYPFFAKVLALSPLTVPLFTRMNSSKYNVRRLLNMTGSQIDDAGLEYYRRLISDDAHVSGTLAMMAQWNLHQLSKDWKLLDLPIQFLVGSQDKIVPKTVSYQVAKEIKSASIIENSPLGHLMHEEKPNLIANQILAFYRLISKNKST